MCFFGEYSTKLPIIELIKDAFLIVVLDWIIVFLIVESKITDPGPILTFGPISQFFITTPGAK